MAIAFRIFSDAAATATSVAPAKPTGLADGDVLVCVQNADANETLTAPGDWTACFAQVQTGSQTARAWYRVVPTAASEPSTYTFGGPGSVARRATIVCYSGVDNTTPMDTTGSNTANVSSTVVHAVSITTATNGAVVVWAGAYDSSTFTVTKPTACTNRNQATALYRLTMADLAMPTAGATGDQDGSAPTARANIGMLIALRPASTQTKVLPPLATATGAAAVPTDIASVPVPVSTATGVAQVSTQILNVLTPVATATADAFVPTVVAPAGPTTVAVPLATVTAAALVPAVRSTVLLHPSSDVSVMSWSDQLGGTTNLFSVIDELAPDDADYLRSSFSAGIGDEIKERFPGVVDPLSSVNHILRYRYSKDASAGDNVDLVVTLYDSDGVTVIHSVTHTNVTAIYPAFTEGEFTLSGGEADAITGYASGLVLGLKRG